MNICGKRLGRHQLIRDHVPMIVLPNLECDSIFPLPFANWQDCDLTQSCYVGLTESRASLHI